jgi:hypothetical protein
MFESLASCFASRCSAFAQHDSAVYEMSLIHVPAFCPELFACAPYRKCAQQKIEMIKAGGVVCLALLFLPAGVPAQNQYAGGIVYGPKAAFNIAAPEGWVLDNESGVEQGLPCVLYPKGESWADARTVIYAKIAGTNYEDAEKFVQVAIKQMHSKHGKPKEKIDKGTTGNGQSFFINEYPATKTYSQWERVAYIQLPKAVAYIVLSSRDEASYRKDAHALREVLKRFTYLEPKTETGAH